MKRAVLNVTGMTCGHCVAAVRNALEAVPGVHSADVTLTPPRASVLYDPARATVDRRRYR